MIADIYELSPMQAGMLFHRLFAPESTAYFDQFSCRLAGDIDVVALRTAWQHLVDRHAVLRTSFHWEGLDKPVQVVHTGVTLPWEVHDWRDVPPEAQAARWAAWLAADRARGFQPDAAPLMRLALVRLAEREYAFCWSHHHLLLDGWCLTLVLSEVFARYDALRRGATPHLPPVRQYGDYIKWLQRRDPAPAEQYWMETLRGFSAPTPLFASAPRAAAGPVQADARIDRQLDPALTARLGALAAASRLTLNTLIQGAWALILSRYSGSDDVVFGVTVSGRPPDVPGIETMLGVFINTLPARVPVPEEMTAAAWLADVQTRHVAREPHAALPLTELQKLSDVEPGAPLFDTNVIVMNYRMDQALGGGAAGIEVRDLRIVDQTDIPLTVQVTPGPSLQLELLYDSRRFDAGAMARMLGHVAHVLAQFAEGLDRPLSAFEVVTPDERAQIIDGFNATDAPLDTGATIVRLWEAQVAATPDAVALECDDVRLTYREVNERVNRLARGLRACAPDGRPVGTDALVAIAFRRSERLVLAMLAVWKCGAAYVPIDPDYPADRIRRILETAAPVVVLREAGTLDAALEADAAGRTRFVSMADLEQQSRGMEASNPGAPATGTDLAYVIFTSGSTGTPKGAMVEQTGMINHLLAKVEDLHLTRDTVIVQNASHCFDISVWQCLAALVVGGRTIVYTDTLVLDPAACLARVRADRVTVLEVVPSYLAPLLDCVENDPRPLSDLQYLLVTGETIKPALVERWFGLCPSIPMVNAYGPTEASDDITHAIMHEAPAGSPVPVGRPLRNFHIYVVDDRLRLRPIGVAGELCVSGPGVGRGYLHDPVRTAAAFLEDPFRPVRGVRMYRTGDIGWFAEDGTLRLSGRRDYQVKVRGYRIELGDIEAALTRLDAVRDAVVIDRRDRAAAGVYLAAYVTLQNPSATPARILEALAAQLPDYMVPSTCTVLATLPLTPNGKIDRKALPAPVWADQAEGAPPAAPRSPAEQVLAGIWGEVLGVDAPGIHDNFFAAGGDSILSMQLVSRAARAGWTLTPRDVFQHQTIAELAAVARPAAAGPSGARARTTGPAPLAPAQRRFFDDVVVDRHHYNQSILLEVPPGFDAARCARALDAVTAHHEALRLRFAEHDGVWRQTVAAPGPATIVETHPIAGLETVGAGVQASLDLAAGPLVRAAWFDAGPSAPGRLLIVAHHLAVDGVSWRILLEDLAAAYDALGRGEPVTLPPVTTAFLDWAAAQPAGAVAHPAGPATGPLRTTVASQREIIVELEAPITLGFMTLAPQAWQTGPTELLMAATALAYTEWTGERAVRVDLELHGRDQDSGADVTRTVGWFTSTFPVSIEVPPAGATPRAIVDTAARAVRQAAVDRASDAPYSPVLLNYHGRLDAGTGAWRLSSDPHGPDRSPRQTREHLIEINSFVSDARLRVTFGFSTQVHTADDMRAFGDALARHLTAIVGAARADRALDRAVVEAGDAEDVYDLSPTQQGLLFHALVDPSSGAYFNQLTCTLQGDLQAGVFEDAWRVTVQRHAVLRTSFHWQGLERPVQIVHRTAEIPWLSEDWSAWPEAAQRERWERLADEDRARPFNLSAAPLMRCALVRTGPGTWWFRWSQHHLLLDGWSSSIVLGDVLAAYDALVGGARIAPPAPPPFRRYIEWLQQQDAAAARRYWRRELEGFDTPTPLPLGLPEMEGRASHGQFAEAEARVPEALTARLQSLAASNRITLHTLFQGLWALLLGRYSGSDDVVFGSIVSGRPPALDGADRMVGLFINTIPVRARLADQVPVFDWLRGLQQAHAQREECAYASLADVQRESAVPGGAPLFESILIFENYPVGTSLAQAGGVVSVGDVQAREPNNYPVTVVVTPGAALALKIMFDEGRFDRATIDRMFGHLVTALETVAARPDALLGAVPLLTAHERAQLDRWNDTAAPVPAGETVLSRFEAHAARTPDRTAVRWAGEAVSYAELNRRADRRARAWLASGRLRPDAAGGAPRIVVQRRRSTAWLETLLAIWKCGAVYVPVDSSYPAARLHAIVANAQPAMVITDTASDEPAAPGDAALPAHCDPASLAYVIYTSGSTGTPKGAMVEHVGLLNHVQSMIDDLHLDAHCVVAQTASSSFDISMWQLVAALVAGGTTVIYPDDVVHRPLALAAAFDADRVTVAQCVPSYLNVFLDAVDVPDRPPLSALTHMVTIGEALMPATLTRWFDLYPAIPLMNAYGPTEASDSVAHADFAHPLGDAPVPIGWPIRNMALHVTDHAMRLCPVGVKGEICIAGAGVGRGYLNDEARTREVFAADPFSADARRLYRTGDIGCRRPDGALLFFGRRDHQVKIRGHRIELGEIESCLSAIDGVRDAAVVAAERRAGDRVLAAYVTTQGGRELDASVLTRALAERLPAHAVPEVLEVLPAMPVLASGKIDRRALQSRQIAAPAAASPPGPLTETERVLAAIWADVLGETGIGPDQSFFELGGHSLKAIQIVSRVNRECGVDLGVADLFECATVRRLAHRVASSAASSGPADLVRLPDTDSGLYDASPMQTRMWLACRTPDGAAAYTMAGVFTLDGEVDRPSLARAFRALVERHEALRTVFVLHAGVVRQQVRPAADVGEIWREWPPEGEAAGADAAEAAMEARIAEPMDLATGPLCDATLLRVGPARHLLIVRLHHLVGDAMSIRILLEEAAVLYASFRAGRSESPLAPLPLQYRDVVAWQARRASREAAQASRQYWIETLRAPLPRTELAAEHAAPAPAAAVTGSCDLDAALTARVRTVAREHDTTVFGVIVSAIYGLLYRMVGQEDLVIGSTVSRRDVPLLERQVGCYIDTVVLRGRAAGRDLAADLIARTARVCRDGLAHRDYPFDSVLTDLGVSVPAGKTPIFDVLVDYVPGSGAPSLDAGTGLTMSEYVRASESAHAGVMFLVSESDDGTRLSIRLVLDGTRFTPDTVARVAAHLRAVLHWLAVEGPGTLGEVSLISAPETPRRRLRIRVNTS